MESVLARTAPTYHRLDEAALVQLELPHRLVLIGCALHNLTRAILTEVLHDGQNLVGRRRVLRHVELPLLVLGLGVGVVARSLVDGRGRRGIGMRLLEHIQNADG